MGLCIQQGKDVCEGKTEKARNPFWAMNVDNGTFCNDITCGDTYFSILVLLIF